jgi:transglutaminase superfamily protein
MRSVRRSGLGPWPQRIRRLTSVSGEERRLLVEAAGMLLAARLALLVFPYRLFERILRSRWPQPGEADPETVRAVGATVARVARHVPWRAECLVQAAAGRWMLRRRAIGSRLFLGVQRGADGRLQAHAWLRCGDTIVTGSPGHERFRRLREL